MKIDTHCFHFTASNQFISVELIGMAKGIYTVKIGSEESYMIKKLIIQ